MDIDCISKKKYSQCSGNDVKSLDNIGNVSFKITGIIYKKRSNISDLKILRQIDINDIISGSFIN